nr:MAG TPA: anti-sigma factor [Caudoviricetes sp.]
MTSEFNNEMLQCNLVKTFARRYFERRLSVRVEDLILAHLLKCIDCRRAYKDFAQTLNMNFNLKEAVSNFIVNHPDARDHKYCKQLFIAKFGQEVYNELKPSYTYYAETYDVENLKKVQGAFDIMKEKYEFKNDDEQYIEALAEFAKYMTVKMCKNVDLLERCLKCEQ